MNTEAEIIGINETEIIGQNNFQKRTIEVVTISRHPQTLLFEFQHDNVVITDSFKPGDKVTITFDIRGSKYTKPGTTKTMFFTNLVAWNLKKIG